MSKRLLGFWFSLCSCGNVDPLGFKSQADFDFPETETELLRGWKLENRCGKKAIAGGINDQRLDTKCPNVLLINTDDMSWADVSINNPSKIIPTPNIDRLVSKVTDKCLCFENIVEHCLFKHTPHVLFLHFRFNNSCKK